MSEYDEWKRRNYREPINLEAGFVEKPKPAPPLPTEISTPVETDPVPSVEPTPPPAVEFPTDDGGTVCFDGTPEQVEKLLFELRARMLRGDRRAIELAEEKHLIRLIDPAFWLAVLVAIRNQDITATAVEEPVPMMEPAPMRQKREGWRRLPKNWSEKMSALGAAEDVLSGRWTTKFRK